MTLRWYYIDTCLLKFVNEEHYMKPTNNVWNRTLLSFFSMVVTNTWFGGSPLTPCLTGVDHIPYIWQSWCHRRVYSKFNQTFWVGTEFLNILVANLIELDLYITAKIAETYIFSNIRLKPERGNQLIYTLTCLPSWNRLIMTLLGQQKKSTSFPDTHWNVMVVCMSG